MNLKKSVYFEICGKEICLDVNWSLLERAERVFSPYTIDAIPIVIQDPIRVQRSKVADTISSWVQGVTDLTRDEIREYIFTCPQIELIKNIGKIQACICWSIRNDNGEPMITDSAFEKLVNGIDLTDSDVKKPTQAKKEGGTKPKKPRAATSKKPTA